MTRHSRSSAMGALVLLLAVAGAASAAAPASPTTPRISGDYWGWAVARQPTTTDYAPAAKDGATAGAFSIAIHRFSVGSYKVTFSNVGAPGGTALVSPLSTTSRLCNVTSSSNVVPNEVVRVRCFTAAGVLADTAFSVNYLAPDSGLSEVAYAWADQEHAGSYTPDPAYQYDSESGTITITSGAVGSYQVTFPNFGSLGAAAGVQVSTYGITPGYCRTTSWGGSPDLVVDVTCRNWQGLINDFKFNIAVMHNVGLKGSNVPRQAYFWADQPSSASYTPGAAYSYTKWGTAPTVTRSSVGVYVVHLTGIAAGGGSAQVTADGSSSKRCVVSKIRAQGPTQTVGVACFSNAGNPADSFYDFAYTR